MRYSLALIVALILPSIALAQPKPKFEPIAIKKLQVGFRTYKDELDQSAYKPGLWAPVYIEIFGGTDGVAKKPNDRSDPYLEISTNDSEDVGTVIHVGPVQVPPGETRTVLGYVKTGHVNNSAGGEVGVKLHVNGREVRPQPFAPSMNFNLGSHLYLTIGPRNEHFHAAVKKIDKQPGNKEFDDFRFSFRNAVYENKVERLPDVWYGYNGVDLMILSTDTREFLTVLNQKDNDGRLRAIAQWVRCGGRLVIPVNHESQDALHALLTNPAAWTPPIPVVPPRVSANLQLDEINVANWAQAGGEAFHRDDRNPIPIATLDPGRVPPGDWDLEAKTLDGQIPLIASVRYGLGQIHYIAFSLQDKNFLAWKGGNDKFIARLVKEFAPKAPDRQQNQMDDFRFQERFDQQDHASQLLFQLDKFGVTVIDFGYVALFIVLYILIVGPLDFILLKYVFKRLEWTWITFPSVVLAVSIIAYFAAYGLKGKDLKINKVDVVDFDLRTSRDQPRVYGNSFFTILSPRIQNYTVGLEPNPEFWGEPADKTRNVDLLSWMGRPSGGPGGMDRGGSGGFFRNAYQYTDDATGVRGVPIPVWTTKAFMASWEQPLNKDNPPFQAKLTWFKQKDAVLEGTLENHLGVDLVDAWLIFEDRFYPIDGGLKSVKKGAAPVQIRAAQGLQIAEWVGRNTAGDDVPGDAAGNAQQTVLMKQLLFHEKWDTQRNARNHLLRSLDFGWRVKNDSIVGDRDLRTREVILFARVRPPVDDAETLTASVKNPLPTKLWLRALPVDERARPSLSGKLNQDTYVRVLLSARPAQ